MKVGDILDHVDEDGAETGEVISVDGDEVEVRWSTGWTFVHSAEELTPELGVTVRETT